MFNHRHEYHFQSQQAFHSVVVYLAEFLFRLSGSGDSYRSEFFFARFNLRRSIKEGTKSVLCRRNINRSFVLNDWYSLGNPSLREKEVAA